MRSILNHEVFRGNDVQAVLIAIHGFAQDHSDAMQLVRHVSEDVLAYVPSAARPVQPRYSGDLPSNRAKLWYFEQGGVIEPSLFADSLRQLEALLFDVVEHKLPELPEQTPVFLLGSDQGATLALTLGVLWPELVDGVLSVDGFLPEIPGWKPPASDLTNRRFTLVSTTESTSSAQHRNAHTKAALEQLGATLKAAEASEVSRLPSVLRQEFAWLRS